MQETTGNDAEDYDEDEVPEITQWEAIGWLAILTLWISVLSGYLVDAIQVKLLIAYCGRDYSGPTIVCITVYIKPLWMHVRR